MDDLELANRTIAKLDAEVRRLQEELAEEKRLHQWTVTIKDEQLTERTIQWNESEAFLRQELAEKDKTIALFNEQLGVDVLELERKDTVICGMRQRIEEYRKNDLAALDLEDQTGMCAANYRGAISAATFALQVLSSLSACPHKEETGKRQETMKKPTTG